jgi:hypothetical protein
MAEPTIKLGGGNWAGKSDNLLGYYKEGERFYKQDFTFSRSTTGTYTDSDGYIQEMPYNLALYSEEFNNAAYSLTESSITANAINSPIGTLTADKLVENTSNDLHRVGQGSISVISGEVYTFSFYVKAAERNELELQRINTSGTVFNSISVTTANLTNGTLSVGSNVTASSIENVGSGWYRISISLTAIANGSGGFNIGMQKNGSVFYQGDGVSGVYVWGFQAVKGTSAKTYFPTTTRLNMPRVDYLNNSNGSLILESQRTNVFTESNNYTGWNGYQATSNTTTAPDGNSVLFLDFEDVRMFPTTTISSGTEYTSSIYLKANKVADVKLRNARNEDTIISLTTDWVRYELTATSNATSTNALLIDARFSQGLGASDLEIALFGGQIEQGSYATTLINTSGSSVTRNADACSISNVADRIGQTEGVIFIDFELQTTGEDFVIMNLYNTSSASNGIYFYLDGSNLLKAYCDNSGNQVLISSGVLSEGRFKAAFAYKENDFAFYLNGSLIGVDNSGTVPTCGALRLENYQNSPTYQEKTKVYQAQIYNTRLSNSELATLTTL